MTDKPQLAVSPAADATPTEPKPAPPSAWFVVLCLSLMLSSGVMLGLVCHWIGLSYPKGAAFKFLIAAPLAIIGILLLHGLSLPRKYVLLLAAVGGIAAMASMHYFDYRDFPRRLDPRLRDVLEVQVLRFEAARLADQADTLEAGIARLKPELRKKVEHISASVVKTRQLAEQLRAMAGKLGDEEKEQEMEPILRRFGEPIGELRGSIVLGDMALGKDYQGRASVVDPWSDRVGFWDYLDLRAEQGAHFDVFGRKLHLGYGTTWAWWGVEIVIAGLCAGLIMRKLAADKDVEKDTKELFAPAVPADNTKEQQKSASGQ